jgi:hypothetical protein
MSRPTTITFSRPTFCSAASFSRLRLRNCAVAWPTFQAPSSLSGLGYVARTSYALNAFSIMCGVSLRLPDERVGAQTISVGSGRGNEREAPGKRAGAAKPQAASVGVRFTSVCARQPARGRSAAQGMPPWWNLR